MDEGYEGNYFIQLCKEALRDLKKGKTAIVFTQAHVDWIKQQKGFNHINVTHDDYAYYLNMA